MQLPFKSNFDAPPFSTPPSSLILLNAIPVDPFQNPRNSPCCVPAHLRSSLTHNRYSALPKPAASISCHRSCPSAGRPTLSSFLWPAFPFVLSSIPTLLLHVFLISLLLTLRLTQLSHPRSNSYDVV